MDVLQPLLRPGHPAPPAALPAGVWGRRLLGAPRALRTPPPAQHHPALPAAPLWPLGGALPLEPGEWEQTSRLSEGEGVKGVGPRELEQGFVQLLISRNVWQTRSLHGTPICKSDKEAESRMGSRVPGSPHKARYRLSQESKADPCLKATEPPMSYFHQERMSFWEKKKTPRSWRLVRKPGPPLPGPPHPRSVLCAVGAARGAGRSAVWGAMATK